MDVNRVVTLRGTSNKIRPTGDRKAFEALSYTFILLVTILCLLPFWLVIIGSFTSEAEIYQRGYSLWPHEFSLEAYKTAFKYPAKVLRAYGVTVSITVIGTMLSLLFTALCGYALQLRGLQKPWIFYDVYLLYHAVWRRTCAMVPADHQLLEAEGHLSGSDFDAACQRLFRDSHEKLHEDRSKGADRGGKNRRRGEFFTFFRIVLPLAKPALASIGMFTALNYWNEWRTGMLFLQNDELFPLQYYLYRLLNSMEFLKNADRSNVF